MKLNNPHSNASPETLRKLNEATTQAVRFHSDWLHDIVERARSGEIGIKTTVEVMLLATTEVLHFLHDTRGVTSVLVGLVKITNPVHEEFSTVSFGLRSSICVVELANPNILQAILGAPEHFTMAKMQING